MLKSLRNTLVGWLGAGLIRATAATLRVVVEDESGLVADPRQPEPVIFALWHNRMFLMPWFYRRLFPSRRIRCLVSASQDGEMIARVLAGFDMDSARGSSSRRGKEACRELADHLAQGSDVAITPDGPRGPCYQAQLGVVGLAALTARRVVPVTLRLDSHWQLRSWDRFMIPRPFSRCVLRLGKPMTFDGAARDELLEKGRSELEERLNASN